MAAYLPSVGLQGGSSEDLIRTQFATREGTYRLMPLPDYTRSLRLPLGSSCNVPIRLSFVIVTDPTSHQVDDLMCFNINRELHVYRHDISDKASDIVRPVEKKFYQCTFPTCHDFNQHVANPDRIPLLIGFANGQIHLLNLAVKEFKKSFNVDQLIDKSKVTCVRWVPGSKTDFVVSHASGQLYIYDESLPCVSAPPTYQSHKQGLGFSIHTCKTKVGMTRNPKSRWYFNDILCINEVAFSPCTRYIAIVSQDGFLRVFNFQFQEVVGAMKSYFGGLRCVCWSPDSKYIVTGGEDDLVTVWSLAEKRVICRYVGHKSWVSVVAFDSWTTILSSGTESSAGASDSSDCAKHFVIGDDQPSPLVLNQPPKLCAAANTEQNVDEGRLIAYRFASVSEDTQLCLWELTEDNLVPHVARNRLSTLGGAAAAAANDKPQASSSSVLSNGPLLSNSIPSAENHSKSAKTAQTGAALLLYSSSESSSLSEKYASLQITEQHQSKESKRPYGSLGSRLSDMRLLTNRQVLPKAAEEALKHLGVSACPQLNEVPMLNPLVCKKISRERLTGVAFRENSIVTVCQEGIIKTWSRPGSLNNGYL